MRARLALLAAALLAAGGVTASGADFVAGSSSPGNDFAAAPDFNTVAVALTDPGTPRRGTVALAATASSERGIARVRFQTAPAGGGSWADACEDAAAPYGCDWDSAGVADGARDVRAVAVDQAGYQRSASVASRMIDNTAPSATVPALGAVRGTIAVPVTAEDGAGSGVARVTVRLRPAGGSWSDLCVIAAAPWTCTGVDTATRADGLYELQAVAEDAAGHSATSAAASLRIDNTLPATPTLTNPGATVSGAASLAGTASDTGSGIATWTAQYRIAGTTAWLDACTATAAPYACAWNTAAVADGLYDLRALATDAAGNQRASSTQTNKRVDNTPPAVSLADPGTPLAGTVSLTATAADDGGVVSVAFERSPAGAGTWTTICTDTSAPYTCAFDTTAAAEGAYDLRARAIDGAGHVSTSVVAGRLVNNPPRGVDVQTPVTGATAGRLETGDAITFTWSEPIAPASVLAGWTGAPVAIRVNLTNSSNNDRMDFANALNTARLNLVNTASDLRLGGNFISSSTGAFAATMTQSGNTITVTLAARISGALQTASAGTMTWTPSALALDLSGKPAATALVTESGPLDQDF